MTRPRIQPEVLVTQEPEQNDEQQPVRGRKHSSPDQERSGRARPKHEDQKASGSKRRRKESVTSEIPEQTSAWQPEELILPERPSSGKARGDKRRADKPSSFGRASRTMGKRRADSFAAPVPQQRTARSKPKAIQAARARRTAASNRSASR
jgi:hypothetical protein